MLKTIETQEGYRTKTGYHTGYAILTNGHGDYFVSQESGVKKITIKGIAKLRRKRLDKQNVYDYPVIKGRKDRDGQRPKKNKKKSP